MASNSPSGSRPSSTETSQNVSRPSSVSFRPHLGVQTRMRSRSLTNSTPSTNSNSSSNSSGGANPPPHSTTLSPTLVGSPPLDARDDSQARFSGHRPSFRGSNGESFRSKSSLGRTSLIGEIFAERETGPPSMEESNTSTDTESLKTPPETPTNDVTEPQPGVPTFNVTQDWQQAENKSLALVEKPKSVGDLGRKRGASLEGAARAILKRGRSFTSLWVQPTTPTPSGAVRPDPIKERVQIQDIEPKSAFQDIESGEERSLGSNDPPTASRNSAASVTVRAAPLSAYSRPPKTLRDFIPQLILLVFLFVSSFVLILLLIATLPNLFIPHSVADLPELTSNLSSYRTSTRFAEFHLFTVLSALFLWKQCFSIPGSVLTNILFGALYGTAWGTLFACIWTAVGSTGAYMIAKLISPLVEFYFAKPLEVTRRALKLNAPSDNNSHVPVASTGDLFSHLLLARFFPLLPYSVLNIIAGVLRLPLGIFFITLVIGSFPFNFVTVSIGELVALAAADPSTPLSNKIWSKEVLTKLVLVTLVSVVPLLFKKQLQRLLASPTLAALVGGIPTQFQFFVDRIRDSIVRRIFGFGILTSSAAPNGTQQKVGSVEMNGNGLWRRQGEWRRKWNRSWAGDGFKLERLSTGSQIDRSFLSRWDGDEGNVSDAAGSAGDDVEAGLG